MAGGWPGRLLCFIKICFCFSFCSNNFSSIRFFFFFFLNFDCDFDFIMIEILCNQTKANLHQKKVRSNLCFDSKSFLFFYFCLFQPFLCRRMNHMTDYQGTYLPTYLPTYREHLNHRAIHLSQFPSISEPKKKKENSRNYSKLKFKSWIR